MDEFNNFVKGTAKVFSEYFNNDLAIAANFADKVIVTKDGERIFVKVKVMDLPAKVISELDKCVGNCAHRLSAVAMMTKMFKYKHFDIRLNTVITSDKEIDYCWCVFEQ